MAASRRQNAATVSSGTPAGKAIPYDGPASGPTTGRSRQCPPWASTSALIASGASLSSIALLSLTLLARVALALSVGVGVLGDGQVLRDLWLLAPRDVVALGIWIWSFAGNTVAWRGQHFSLKDGKMSRLTAV